MQKTTSLHTSLIFIFGSLNLKSPQKIKTAVTLSVLEGGKKECHVFWSFLSPGWIMIQKKKGVV